MSRSVIYAATGAFVLVAGALAAVALLRSHEADSPDDGPMFEGDLILSFERSSFTPCEDPDTHYWLVWGKEVDLLGELRQLGIEGTYIQAHLTFSGALETGAPGGYGHLGRYAGEVQIMELRELARGSCK